MAESARALGDFDAVIVGAGAGGAAAAWRLTEHGKRVLVVEAGRRFDPYTDYRLDQPDWELSGFPHTPDSEGRYTFARMQALESGFEHLRSWNRVSGVYSRLNERREPSGAGYHHVRGVGGSTLHYTGEAHRMNPHSMKMRSRFGVAADWPVDYDALEPYYCIAERIIGVAGPETQTDRPRSEPFPLPEHPLSRGSRFIVEGGARLGMLWEPNSRAALSTAYDGRPACNYCGNCTRGCPLKDKGSADVTFMAKAEASGRCRVLTNTQVLAIRVDEANEAREIECADASGARFTIPTPLLILAAGAIETPRLLLASRTAAHPHGLGNHSGQVGRNFMETLSWTSVGLAPMSLASFKGLPADTICWDYNRPDSIPGVIGGCRFSSSTHEADLVGPIAYARRIVPGWGRAHKIAMRETLGRAVAVGAIGEHLPNENTFVDLDPDEQDRFGMPLARIHSHLDALDIARLEFMARTCRDTLHSAGITTLVEEYGRYDYFSSTHVFGTCRMGQHQHDSVVDQGLRMHTLGNILITDASVMPSSGGGESPSLTIQALAVRAIDQLALR